MVVNCGNYGLKPPEVGAFFDVFRPFRGRNQYFPGFPSFPGSEIDPSEVEFSLILVQNSQAPIILM